MRVIIRRRVLQERKNSPIKKKHLKPLREFLDPLSVGIGALIMGVLLKLFPKLREWLGMTSEVFERADEGLRAAAGVTEAPATPAAAAPAGADGATPDAGSEGEPEVGDPAAALAGREDGPAADGEVSGELDGDLSGSGDESGTPAGEAEAVPGTSLVLEGDPPLEISEDDFEKYLEDVSEARNEFRRVVSDLTEKVKDPEAAAAMDPKPSEIIADKLQAIIDAYASIRETHAEEVERSPKFAEALETHLAEMSSVVDGIKNIDMMSIIASKEGSGSLYAQLPELKDLFDKDGNWFKFASIIAGSADEKATDVRSDKLRSVTGVSESKKFTNRRRIGKK